MKQLRMMTGFVGVDLIDESKRRVGKGAQRCAYVSISANCKLARGHASLCPRRRESEQWHFRLGARWSSSRLHDALFLNLIQCFGN